MKGRATPYFRAPSPLPTHGRGGRSEEAYQVIKGALLEGGLEPGDKLSVVSFAKQLGCSRVPIMEALKRLENDGFVSIVPQVGCSVAVPRINDIRDFFLMFARVESLVAAFAAERRTADDLDEFRRLCAYIDDCSAAAGGPDDRDPEYRRLNILFHTQIHRMARSPGTSRIAAALWDRSDFYIKIAFGSLYFSERVRRSHRRIRRAIGDGDAAGACKYVADQLEMVGAGIVRRLHRRAVDVAGGSMAAQE